MSVYSVAAPRSPLGDSKLTASAQEQTPHPNTCLAHGCHTINICDHVKVGTISSEAAGDTGWPGRHDGGFNGTSEGGGIENNFSGQTWLTGAHMQRMMQKEGRGGLQNFTSTEKPLEKVKSWGMKGVGRMGSLNRKAELGYLCVGFGVWTEWPKEAFGGTSGTIVRLGNRTRNRDLYN